MPYSDAIFLLLILILQFGVKIVGNGISIAPAMYDLLLLIAGGMGSFFILDLSDLRYFATGFVIITLLSIAIRLDAQTWLRSHFKPVERREMRGRN